MNVSGRSVQPGAGSAIPQPVRLNGSALAKGAGQRRTGLGDRSTPITPVTRQQLAATLALAASRCRPCTWLIQVDVVGGELVKSS